MKLIPLLAILMMATQAQATETLLAQGAFHGGNYAPSDTASGGVTLIKLQNGHYELRLGDDFSTTPGPDLFIYLSTAADPTDGKTIKANAFVDAGKLNSPKGGQKFSLPANFETRKFKSVAIWCKQFGILFGAAALTQ